MFKIEDFLHSLFSHIIAGMGVGVQRDPYVRVTYQVLQILDGQFSVRHIGTEGMAENMGRYRQFIVMALIVVVDDALQCVFQMSRHFRLSVLVQK